MISARPSRGDHRLSGKRLGPSIGACVRVLLPRISFWWLWFGFAWASWNSSVQATDENPSVNFVFYTLIFLPSTGVAERAWPWGTWIRKSRQRSETMNSRSGDVASENHDGAAWCTQRRANVAEVFKRQRNGVIDICIFHRRRLIFSHPPIGRLYSVYSHRCRVGEKIRRQPTAVAI